jgi:FkbH-like protein
MLANRLSWLPPRPDWNDALGALAAMADAEAWPHLVALANARLDSLQTLKLDRRLVERFGERRPPGLATKPVRLAVLASSTVDHLLPSLRVGALRRGLKLDLWRCEYGQYAHELLEPNSALHGWAPDTILLCLDAPHLLAGFRPAMAASEVEAKLEALLGEIVNFWRIARERLSASVIQQTLLPVFPRLFGNNEHRLPGSPHRLVDRFNQRLRELADAEGVDLLAIDDEVRSDGLAAWYDPVLWLRAKQEVHPTAAPLYGDLLGRLLAAKQGRSAKCLVLDLDNTLWGGVIGDDGLEGIVLGQGSAVGEAYLGFQHYARDLAARGVILAICSKNDEKNALEPFDKHPEMVLRRADIACFAATWQDKATAIRQIAEQLNIGLDSLVFVDDNPFERTLVRRALPMVAVPELPEDPALYAGTLAAGGYFEGLHLTAEDLARTSQYKANAERERLKSSATDLEGYLRSLGMELRWGRFDKMSQQRVTQLINKTNQFNLTTRRYTDEEVAAVAENPRMLSMHLRLIDQFGDNGIIAIIIGRLEDDHETLLIDTWLMSCRVLGRQVEETTLSLIVEEARRMGAKRILGEYRPTAKNDMVREHYPRLGFSALPAEGETTRWARPTVAPAPAPSFIKIIAE